MFGGPFHSAMTVNREGRGKEICYSKPIMVSQNVILKLKAIDRTKLATCYVFRTSFYLTPFHTPSIPAIPLAAQSSFFPSHLSRKKFNTRPKREAHASALSDILSHKGKSAKKRRTIVDQEKAWKACFFNSSLLSSPLSDATRCELVDFHYI